MTSCRCFSPGSGEGCPAAPKGTVPPSGPEGSPGAAPHCPAHTACPEPGLTASPQGPARGGAGRLAQRPLPAPPGSPGFPTLQSPPRVCHWGFFQTLHLISSKDAVRSAKPSAHGGGQSGGPGAHRGRGRAGGARPGPAPGRGQRRAGKARSLPGRGAAGANHRGTGKRAHAGPAGPAGPGTARDIPAQPRTPRHTPGHPAAVQQHASPGAAGSRAASYCSGHPPAASAKRQVFAWPVTQP